MLHISEIQGAILDLDDTLLDNGPIDKPAEWLHTRSRLEAIRQIGAEQGIPELATMPEEANAVAFTTARVHSLQGAVWNLLHQYGLVMTEDIDPDHPLYGVVEAIFRRKNELHIDIIKEYGREVTGAADFIRKLGGAGLANHLALATNAVYPEVSWFLDRYDLRQYFPDKRVVHFDKVTRPKPDPESFDLAYASLELPESARRYTLGIEDNPRGLIAAKRAGLYTCAITTRHGRDDPRLLAAGPDVIFDSYEELAEQMGLAA